MAEKGQVPLGVGFYPDWFHKEYGLSFGKTYYFDPEARVRTRMEIERRLHERFGEVGLGNPAPEPKPLITFGMVMLPAVFGCEIVFKDDALPWAMPLNLSEAEIMRLKVPDLLHTSPMTEVIGQIDHLKSRYGRVIGDINTTGVQNLALKIRGDRLYVDFFENPPLCRHLLGICAEAVIQLFRFNRRVTGTGAVDVTPMCDPKLCVLPNCTIEQISNATYEKFVLEFDNRVADACAPIGIHHCGSVDEVLDGYSKVRHLEFMEIGFGSDVERTRKVLGPAVAVNARISPVLMKNGTAEEVALEVRRLIDRGAPLENFSIDTVGLTAGTPDENVRAALKTARECGKRRSAAPTGPGRSLNLRPAERERDLETRVSSALKEVVLGGNHPLAVIGERINPTGRRRLSQALGEGNLDLVRSEALRQVKMGAHLLDVNVGVSGVDEPALMRKAVHAVTQVTDVPLCLDSASPDALMAGLEVYGGKALVNSVNGEKEKLKRILPLVKEHGAAVIGLTMDDQGIPRSAEKRLAIAARIVEEAERLGIPREDVIIDPLAMSLSVDHLSAVETIRALRLIRDELGVNQVLGLSNISFGLPERASVNAGFLAMAVLSGLTCAIADPTNSEMRKAVLISDLLLGKDEACMQFVSQMGPRTRRSAKKAPPVAESDGGEDLPALRDAVLLGRRKEAVTLTEQAISQGMDPQAIIDQTLIPSLNLVGGRFERKEIFVPEMMISARTMQACLDRLKPLLKKGDERPSLGTVVLGTVQGDLHDIGKNLAGLLMETAGFHVVDLGENVDPERFVQAAREHGADLVGISSLLTTGDAFLMETVRAIKGSDVGHRVKVICGGAAVTPRLVEICGADAYAKDAAEGVKKSKALLGLGLAVSKREKTTS